MKLIILCGGMGTRMQDYSFPKPLNMIYGKPSIAYCLSKIPDSIIHLHFIYNPLLDEFNFEEVIKNEFKTKKCTFKVLPYVTRGAIESAYLGMSHIEDTDENVVFFYNHQF